MTVTDCPSCGRKTTLSQCIRCVWAALHGDALEYISGVLATFERERLFGGDPPRSPDAWATRFDDIADGLNMLAAAEAFAPTTNSKGIEHAEAVREAAQAAYAVVDAVRREAASRRTAPRS